MRTLITGATGFIGRRLAAELLARGEEVHALVRDPASPLLPRGARAIVGDVLDPALADAAKAQGAGGYRRVFHLAGIVSFRPEMRPALIRMHAEGTRNVLAAARAWDTPVVVAASSACTIGLSRSADLVLDETAPFDPRLASRNPYLDSKLAMEDVCRQAADAGQRVVVVNPTTVYGAGDATLNSGTLVKAVATSGAVPVPPGGSNVVDLGELVLGLLAASEHGRAGERYILGGHNLRFAQIVDDVARAAGKSPLRLPLPGLLAGPMSLAAWLLGLAGAGRFLTPQIVGDLFGFKYYSSEKAARELGWRAARPFADTVAEALAYYRAEGLIP